MRTARDNADNLKYSRVVDDYLLQVILSGQQAVYMSRSKATTHSETSDYQICASQLAAPSYLLVFGAW